jgi:anti-sigma-K factor RskA
VNTDVHTLSGAYALNAVSQEEAERFEEHLESCSACREEVRELQAAAAQMAAGDAVPPPAELKARVMAAARQQPQMPPLVPQVITVGETPAVRKRFPRLLVAAAASVAVIVAAGIGYNEMTDSSTPGSTLAAGVVRVFEAPDAHQATMVTTNGGRVSVATSPSLQQMAVDTDELPDPGDGRVYQLWAMADGAAAVSAGVLEDPDSGAAMAMPAEGIRVSITIEPAGGSEQPTGVPIMTVTPREV